MHVRDLEAAKMEYWENSCFQKHLIGVDDSLYKMLFTT